MVDQVNDRGKTFARTDVAVSVVCASDAIVLDDPLLGVLVEVLYRQRVRPLVCTTEEQLMHTKTVYTSKLRTLRQINAKSIASRVKASSYIVQYVVDRPHQSTLFLPHVFT